MKMKFSEMFDRGYEIINRGNDVPGIEMFGKKLIISDNMRRDCNWCTICALNDICDGGKMFNHPPCENSEGIKDKHFLVA